MGRICTQRDGQDRFARSELDTPGHCRSRIACRASARQPIITRDVTEEPRWKPWLWLANEFDYRACWSFPVETSSGSSAFCHVFQEASRSDRKRTPIRLSVSSRCRRRPCHDRILRCNDGWVQCPRWPQRIPRVEENPAPPKLRIWPPTSKTSDYWRFRAEEVLSIAEDLEREDTNAIMRRIADDYERTA